MTQTTAPVRVPDELIDLLTDGTLGHVTCITPAGALSSYIMWIDYDGEHLLTSSRVGSFKGRAFRGDPRVAVSVVDRNDPWRYVEISGRVTDIRPDTELAFIDRMSRRYTGQDYRMRDWEREIFVITPERIRTSSGRR
jgi:PPOX class probable F420-dependent enzyme